MKGKDKGVENEKTAKAKGEKKEKEKVVYVDPNKKLLSTEEASARMGGRYSPRTLEDWRRETKAKRVLIGPPFMEYRRRVSYPVDGIDRFISENSTVYQP